MSIDFDSLSLTDIIRLQNQLSTLLSRRFEKWLAIVFSDIVGSTAYFQRYGDQAGRQLQQRHLDLLGERLRGTAGRIGDTAGDGALLVFPGVEEASDFSIAFFRALSNMNKSTPFEHRWQTRMCIHWGAALTDGVIVAGDTVNLCAKLAATSRGDEIILTSQAFSELPVRYRAICHPLESIQLPGVAAKQEIVQLRWRDQREKPRYLVIEETGEQVQIPDKPVLSCGRFSDKNSPHSNDIVLTLPDSLQAQRISRWHFELRSESDQLFLRAISDKPTVVNGITLKKGEQATIENDARVQLSGVITLTFRPSHVPEEAPDLTLPH